MLQISVNEDDDNISIVRDPCVEAKVPPHNPFYHTVVSYPDMAA